MKGNKMKIKFRNWLATSDENSWQVAILPHLCIFGGDGTYCLCFGWLTHSIELWWGNTKDLI
jgi:hypothetical protein